MIPAAHLYKPHCYTLQIYTFFSHHDTFCCYVLLCANSFYFSKNQVDFLKNTFFFIEGASVNHKLDQSLKNRNNKINFFIADVLDDWVFTNKCHNLLSFIDSKLKMYVVVGESHDTWHLGMWCEIVQNFNFKDAKNSCNFCVFNTIISVKHSGI